MTKKKVLTTEERREAAIVYGVQLAKKCGAERVSMAGLAAKQGVSAPRLFHIFGTKGALTKAIEKRAKKDGVTLADGLPTIIERRKTAAPVKKLKPLAPPKAVKRGPLKLTAPPAPKKVAAILKKPVGIKVAGKLIEAPKGAKQKEVKVAPVLPVTKAEKFKALPKPFEASIAAVAK